MNIAGTAQFDPRQAEAEISYGFDAWRLTTGLTWNQWSRFPQPIQYAVQPDDMTDIPAPGFSDSWEATIAMEWSGYDAFVPISTRTGYRWIQTPTDEQTGFHSFSTATGIFSAPVHILVGRHLASISVSSTSWVRTDGM